MLSHILNYPCRRAVHNDLFNVQQNLITRLLTQYIKGLSVFAKAVPQHIQHKYSVEKSEVIVVDVLMKNEACRGDMIALYAKLPWEQVA